jgi:hypothetical protein
MGIPGPLYHWAGNGRPVDVVGMAISRKLAPGQMGASFLFPGLVNRATRQFLAPLTGCSIIETKEGTHAYGGRDVMAIFQ